MLKTLKKPKSKPESLRKIIFKHDGCSMVLFKDLPVWKASTRVAALERLYPDWCGKLLIIK
jgi:hypothetical protein